MLDSIILDLGGLHYVIVQYYGHDFAIYEVCFVLQTLIAQFCFTHLGA